MKPESSRCERSRIEAFLESASISLNDEKLLEHLDECVGCREYIEEAAADQGFFAQVADNLAPAEFDYSDCIEFSAAALNSSKTGDSIPIQAVIDSLAPTDDPHHLGRLGEYEVSGVVGIGGMGVVLKAIDPALDRVVAIKVMAPHLATRASARKRFAREARAAAAVLHPNVIPIHSVSSDDVLPYLVMGYVRGGSLQKRLDREGALSTVEILRIGSQIAAGLAAAHGQGLVHRDIKPANILLEKGVERVTLTDFGLARAVDDSTLTQHGIIAGTPQYMSPEQARGESVDQASDLFSLGSVLYTLCSGSAPFQAHASHGVMRKIIDEEPVPISEHNPSVPEWLCRIVARLMEKDKSRRLASSDEAHEMLESCLSHIQHPETFKLPESLEPVTSRQPVSRSVKFFVIATALLLMGVPVWWMVGPPDFSKSPVANQEVADQADQQADAEPAPALDESADIAVAGIEAQTGDESETEEPPQSWKELFGREPPPGYPTEPLSLIAGLNRSRGDWIFAGQSVFTDGEAHFEADLKIDGGFKRQIETGGFPGWQFEAVWPRVEPQHALKMYVMCFPEREGIRWMLVSQYSDDIDRPDTVSQKYYDGFWDAETGILSGLPKTMRMPEAFPEESEPEDEGSRETALRIRVHDSGEFEILELELSDEVSLSGATAARVGEPYVAPELDLVVLPEPYKVFFASRLETCIVDGDGGVVAGARIDRIGADGDLIYGLITQREGVDEIEDTLGYFVLHASSGEIVKGLALNEWREKLRTAGVDNPRLVAPEQAGPKY